MTDLSFVSILNPSIPLERRDIRLDLKKISFKFPQKLEKSNVLLQPVASIINSLAGALYKVFCSSPDQARKEMRQACFDYLSLGGVFLD